MSNQKGDGRLPTIPSNEILSNPRQEYHHHLHNLHSQGEEETSDCPLLSPSPPTKLTQSPLENANAYADDAESPATPTLDQTLNNINSEDGLAFLNIVNSSCKRMHDEPSSRDPMVETSSNSGSSSDTNEPVCTQLLTQLNTAYTHLAPDAQALFYNQDNGGKPPLTGIQLMVPKPPKNYNFMSWNWPVIRKTFFWSVMSLFAACIALAVSIIATMPKRCDPKVEWWQGSLFYEIFPASFQDSYKNDGIGDLRGITNRLDYLEKLGVKAIRLNSIFLADGYPQRYTNVRSLTEIDPALGTLADFTELAASVHDKNMAVILDLPLYPYVKDFGQTSEKSNGTIRRRKRNDIPIPTTSFSPGHEQLNALLSENDQADVNILGSTVAVVDPLDDHVVTKAIRFWHKNNVDGFYLKGLEHYTNDTNFAAALRYWKSIIGSDKILICSETALLTASSELAKNVILNRINLIDVTLSVGNGTKNIKSQVVRVLKGTLFQKPGYPWVHWSTGSVDTPRLSSVLKVANASAAIALMGMMLPGTPSIFYGDEIGILNAVGSSQQNLAQFKQLVPMHWESDNDDSKTAGRANAEVPSVKNVKNLIHKMMKLRYETTPIYVKAVLKNNEPVANGDVRYTVDEVIVIERWYPRRNTYVFVANLGSASQTKDLSSLYYGGYVVVGPEARLNQNIFFKDLTIPPGEAFVIKLDK